VQARPLSKGEVLGCTAPSVEGRDALVYIGDGRCAIRGRRKSPMASPMALRVRAAQDSCALRHRFHLEAIMIANPTAMHYRSAWLQQ
jgi:diphthamide synthase subunit DPH2